MKDSQVIFKRPRPLNQGIVPSRNLRSVFKDGSKVTLLDNIKIRVIVNDKNRTAPNETIYDGNVKKN